MADDPDEELFAGVAVEAREHLARGERHHRADMGAQRVRIRDGVGLGVDLFADPVPYGRNAAFHPSFAVKAGQFGAATIDLRSKITDAGGDKILADSLDEYATIKSAYLQRRQNLIYDSNPPLEDDEDVPATTPAPSPAVAGPPK